jgi:trehalose 6-phosphate phosphatase
MRPLLGPAGRRALRRLAGARAVVALDFDGTLAPIVRDRARAGMRPRTRRLLAQVAARWPTAVISGRGLADLRARLEGVPARWLVGNHGAEGLGPLPGRARLRRQVARWREALQEVAAVHAGVEVEDKGLSLAVHYRNAARPAAARRALVAAAAGLRGARVHEGKRVVNLVSPEAPDKGTAIERLARRSRAQALLFVGDDETDEHGFAAPLAIPYLTARVGRRPGSAARWLLPARADVDRLLALLAGLRRG